MALSKEDLKEINKILNRQPTVCEEHIFDTMWSEHCSYKSSKRVLKQLPTKAKTIALGIGEDAGIIRFKDHNNKSYCIAISHESHNHPSQILPIEGAATGVGGCVRDVYCMGADVIGVLNSLHFGIKEESNKQSLVDEIEEKVVLGIADYGNPLGVPVLGGETLYHKSYNDNCLVNVAALGLVEESKIVHSYVPQEANHEPYVAILLGKPTDATGFGGASFSSATLDDDDAHANMGAVQVHDPFLKRVLVVAIEEILKEVYEQKIPIGFKDLGAGGISCAASEIAIGGGFGININLDNVNVAYDSLPSEVIACSETQERFCFAVPKSFSQTLLDIVNKTFQLHKIHPYAGAVEIGNITKEKTFIMTHNSQVVCNLPVASITTEVSAHREASKKIVSKETLKSPQLNSNITLDRVCEEIISKKMNASKRYVYRCFDNAVKGNTVVYPGEADAVVIKPIEDCDAGLAVSMDSNLYGEVDPYVAGAGAVAESVRNCISVGAEPIALTDCLNYGNPEKSDVFFDFEQGVLGIKEAAEQLSMDKDDPIPIISGNVSFYNESKQGNAVIPSPVICCCGRINDYNNVKTTQFFEPNLDLILIGKRYSEFGGTQLFPFLNNAENVAPQVRFHDEKKQNIAILQAYKDKLVESCHDISVGGFFQTLLEMILGERGNQLVGADIYLPEEIDILTSLFSENGGYVVATKNITEFEKILRNLDVSYHILGKTKETLDMSISHKNNDLLTIDTSYFNKLWNQYNPG